MTNQHARALPAETREAALSQQESLLQVAAMLERAADLVDQALGDVAGPTLSPEDKKRLASVRMKIHHAASLVTKQLT